MLITRRASLRILLAGVTILAIGRFAVAEKLNLNSDGVALQGYDPVAYFTEDKPVEGSEEFSASYDGATYHFASAANRDAFKADPAKYAPQYGGFCAYAVAQGSTASIDPSAYSVVDGKLYLNFSPSVRKYWLMDVPGYIAKADANWPDVAAR